MNKFKIEFIEQSLVDFDENSLEILTDFIVEVVQIGLRCYKKEDYTTERDIEK